MMESSHIESSLAEFPDLEDEQTLYVTDRPLDMFGQQMSVQDETQKSEMRSV